MEPIKAFISYSHADSALKDALLLHLSNLKRQKLISAWNDRDISAGKEWKGEIDDNLASADLILLLISHHFMGSDYCHDIEMIEAVRSHDAGEARVVPIILSPCDWTGAPFSKFQALPRDAKAITMWPNQDEAFANVAVGIRKVIHELQKAAPPTQSPSPAAPLATPALPVATIHPSAPPKLMMLNGQFYSVQSVKERPGEIVEVVVLPKNSAQDAALRALNGKHSRPATSFAYENHGFLATIENGERQLLEGKSSWNFTLRPADKDGTSWHDGVTYDNITPDMQADMRAQLILLGTKPQLMGRNQLEDGLVNHWISGEGPLKVNEGIFPPLRQKYQDDDEFLQVARLSAVFILIATGTVEHVLELELEFVSHNRLHVRFQGRRRQHYLNTVPINIEISGDCPL
jgi:hypothetical protein